jgi:uncharacterized protein (TIGR00369 family)
MPANAVAHAGATAGGMKQLPFPRRIPFVEELGLELWGFGDGQAELQLALSEQHLNSYLVAHGGVLMTLLDVAMAHAARSVTGDDGPGVVTIEMKTSFMRAAEGRLRAVGTLLHRTATMAFTEGSVFNEAGQLCAHATGTFKYIAAVPGGGRSVKPFVARDTGDPAP